MVGTNLGMVRGRKKTPSDKEYVVQLRAGEGGKLDRVLGKKNMEGDHKIIEDV